MESLNHIAQLRQHSPEAIRHAFEHSVIRVMTVLSGRVVLKQDSDTYPNRLPAADYYGSIPIDGFLSGSILLAINREPATKIATRMSSNNQKEMTDDLLLDAIGEMANQIAGKFRTVLSEFGRDFVISTPSIASKPPEINTVDYDANLSYSMTFQFAEESFTVTMFANCDFRA